MQYITENMKYGNYSDHLNIVCPITRRCYDARVQENCSN